MGRAVVIPGFAAALLTAAFAMTTGCVPGDAAPPDPGVAVSTPPPPAPPDRPPGDRVAEGTWVPGYWHWIGDRWAWVPGHWERPPRGAHAWRPPKYSFHDGVYTYQAGGWVSQ
jgi:hypothetical protein